MERLREKFKSRLRASAKAVDEDRVESMYISGKRRGIYEGIQWCLDELNEYPKWVFTIVKIAVFIAGACVGFIIGACLIYNHMKP